MHLCTPLSLTIYKMPASLPHLSTVTVEHQSSIAAHFGAVLSGNPIMTTSPKSIDVKWFFSNLLSNVIRTSYLFCLDWYNC